MNYLEKLLQGAPVEWKTLGEVAKLQRGRVISKQYLSENIGDYPVYSSQTANNGEIGTISTFDFDQEAITWTTDGANAGTVFHRLGKFSITNVCGLVNILDLQQLDYKFLFYWLSVEAKKYVYSGMGNPKLMSNQMEKIKIPIPPLAVQKEIARILDAFTAITSELTSELTLRQKQYQHYRDKLLTFGEEVEWKTLGEVCDLQAGKHIPASKILPSVDGEHIYPCYGGNGIRGYVQDFSHNGKYIFIGRQGALCGNVQRYTGKLYATEHAVVVSCSNVIHPDYMFHLLTVMDLNQYASKSAQPGLVVGKLKDLKIPIPPTEEQKRIVETLDKFDTLTNSISEGLPKEIELRNKQYEYYREMLLGFEKNDE